MILSHLHRFVFIKPRKVAGTSIELALRRICGPGDNWAPLSAYSPKSDSSEYDHQGRGTLGIDPHSPPELVRRMIGRKLWGAYLRITAVRNPFDMLVSQWWWDKRQPRFGAWLRGHRGPLNHCFWFWRDGKEVANVYLRFESIEDDLRQLCRERFGQDCGPLPRTKDKIRKSPAHYSTYYKPDDREHVARLFARELERFGYRFENGR